LNTDAYFFIAARAMRMVSSSPSLCGVMVLVLLSPFLTEVARTLRLVLAPHFGWILAAISLFMLMSEWPKAGDRGPSNWARFRAAWSSLGAGLLTFFLSGLLGIILMYRGFMPVSAAFVNLLPAFIGLFAISMVLTNLMMGTRVPPQHLSASIHISPSWLLRGAFAGSLGGLFAAFFPVVTGGIGAFLAGHATAQRDERSFIVSQGVSKLVYYAGGFLLFFLPAAARARRIGCDGQHGLHAGHAADVLHRRGRSGCFGRVELLPAHSVCALCRALLTRPIITCQHRHADHDRRAAADHDGPERFADRDSGHRDWHDSVVVRLAAHELSGRGAGSHHLEHGRAGARRCQTARIGLRPRTNSRLSGVPGERFVVNIDRRKLSS
jgi:hypothetical protein